MAFQPLIKMSIQDNATGQYYYATLATNGAYAVALSPTIQYIKSLPEGWEKVVIKWDRDPDYMGVIRSKSTQAFSFTTDSRAILQSLDLARGIQANASLIVWQLQNDPSTPTATDAGGYRVAYKSQFDFKTYKDDWQNEKLNISTLDSELFRDIAAWGNNKYQIPFWYYDTVEGVWLLPKAKMCVDAGNKLLYNSSYISSAKPDNLLRYDGSSQILGFHHGAIGDSAHTLPALSQLNQVQNDGTTTWIGNDILQPLLVQGSQVPGSLHPVNEIDFAGGSNSNPYTRLNCSLYNGLATSSGDLDVNISVTGKFDGDIGTGGVVSGFIGFVLFEIGEKDLTPNAIALGHFVYEPILLYPVPSAGIYTPPDDGNFSASVPVTLNNGLAYVFGIIYDSATGDGFGLDIGCGFSLSNLQFSIQSKFDYNSGVVAPSFPASAFLGLRLSDILSTVVPFLATTQTDNDGFPVPVATDYTGVSNYLSDPDVAPSYDLVPYDILISSGYAIHNLEGKSYLSISLNDLFDFCKKVLQCGLSIEMDMAGNQTIVRIENLAYYLDGTTELMDLGFNVFGLEISDYTEGLGANLKAGWTKVDTNSDFGLDIVNTSTYYNTPLSNIIGVMDFEEDNAVADQNRKEKDRAQQVSQPVGTSFDPANPSSDNSLYAFHITREQPYDLPGIVNGKEVVILDPANIVLPGFAYDIKKYPTAQNSDPAAATAPYINGLFYPDTAYNVAMTGKRNLLRNGGYLHSVFDKQDDKYLVYRGASVMQQNNESLALSGIETNLNVGGGDAPIKEFSDVLIGDLDPKLFKPKLIKITTKQPVDMYTIINNNSRGYIKFSWKLKSGGSAIFKGFIWSVAQSLGDEAATEFVLLATPDMAL